MRKFALALAALSILSVAACKGKTESAAEPVASAPAASQIATDTRLGAVLIYADWCGSCKVLDPKINTVKANNSFANTAFVTLDYTDKDDKKFYAAARKAKVAKAVRAQLGKKVKTGQLLLIDMDDKKVVGVIKKDMSEADIAKTIKAAASAA